MVDSHLAAVRESALVRTASEGIVLFVCTDQVPAGRVDEVRSWGVEVEVLPAGPNGHPDPRSVGRLLAERDIQSVFLEGGATLAAVWWDAGLIDRIVAFVAPVVAGGASSPGPLPAAGYAHMDVALRLRDVTIEQSGCDVMVSGYVGEPA
jgi:diaminohydroxyphosphoribosylaminopyrimidine deaminase/5-amino-6-(5-phosphoribosylamino)uracil reductase